MPRALFHILMVALLALAVGACGSEGESAAPQGKAETAAQAEFAVTELDAAAMKTILAENTGKAVFVCFWSVNCPACEKEIPELEALADVYSPDDLKVMLVNLDPTADMIPAFFQGHVPVTEQYHGSNDLAEAYGVVAIPHLVLYDTAGDVFLNKAGFFPAKMLEALVDHATGKAG